MCLAAYDDSTAAMLPASHCCSANSPLARNRAIANSTDIKTLGIYPVLHFIDILVSTDCYGCYHDDYEYVICGM